MNTFYKTICILSFLMLAHTSSAARLYFDVVNPVFGTDQEVTLPLMLDPEGASVNALEATIQFPQNLVFNDVSTGSSIVTTWLEIPHAEKNTLTFSGIIPGGFDGVIDPFKGSIKSPGLVLYATFHTNNKEGVASLVLSDGNAYTNDGSGTETQLSMMPLWFSIKKGALFSSPVVKDDVAPAVFTIELTHDPLIFDGKHFIVFESQDKESGISYYEIKEGASDFKKGTSPYLLSKQSLGVPIVVKAVDKAGNTRLATLAPDAVSVRTSTIPPIFYTALLVLVLLIIFRKKIIKHE